MIAYYVYENGLEVYILQLLFQKTQRIDLYSRNKVSNFETLWKHETWLNSYCGSKD